MAVLAFAASQGAGLISTADVLILVAVALGAIGYAEGAPGSASPTSPRLARSSGFFPWYGGLARGGVAKIGQIQLIQPLLTLAWSAALLNEHVGVTTLVASIAVLASVVATRRTRVTRSSRPPLVTSPP